MIDAEREAQEVQTASGQIATRQLTEQQQLRARIYGKSGRAPEGGPAAHAERWRNRAEAMRQTLHMIESLPTVEAAKLSRQQREETEARRVELERDRVERLEQVSITEHSRRQQMKPHDGHRIGN